MRDEMTPFGQSGIAPFVGTGADAEYPTIRQTQMKAKVKEQSPFSFFFSLSLDALSTKHPLFFSYRFASLSYVVFWTSN